MTPEQRQTVDQFVFNLAAKTNKLCQRIDELIKSASSPLSPNRVSQITELHQLSSDAATIHASLLSLRTIFSSTSSVDQDIPQQITTENKTTPQDIPLTADMFSMQSLNPPGLMPAEHVSQVSDVLDKFSLHDFFNYLAKKDGELYAAIYKALCQPVLDLLNQGVYVNPYRHWVSSLIATNSDNSCASTTDYVVTEDSSEFNQRPGLYGRWVETHLRDRVRVNSYSNLVFDTKSFRFRIKLAESHISSSPVVYVCDKRQPSFINARHMLWVGLDSLDQNIDVEGVSKMIVTELMSLVNR